VSYRNILIDRLIWEEGLKYEPYHCPAGKLTIGIGHNLEANPLPKGMQKELDENGKLSLPSIMQLVNKDIDYAEQDARGLFESFNDFSQNRKVAIVDLVFNLGVAGLRKFITFGAAVRNGQWPAASAALRNSKWYRQVGKRAESVIALIENG
jgi:lysozyme